MQGSDNVEVWKKLIYPNIPDEQNRFEISTYGRLKNTITQYIYKPSVMSSGYYSVRTTLGNKNNKIHIIIHRAMAYTFLPNPNNLPEVNHKDGDKSNNRLSNLEWCTSHENQQHKYDTGLFNKDLISGENNHNAKLDIEEVKYIREHYVKGSKEFGSHAMARRLRVSHVTILSILNNKTWSCA